MPNELHSPLLVVKVGGAAIDDRAAALQLLRQVADCRAAGAQVVLVHGGGQRLTSLAQRLGLHSEFINGRRVTDAGLIEAAKLVFAGGVGTDLAAAAMAVGVPGVAISGVAAGLLTVRKRPVQNGVDYGYVGDVTRVEPKVITALLAGGLVPLVASLGVDTEGVVYNVNADTVACALAAALKATKLLVLTDTDGVLRELSDPHSRIPWLNAALLRDGTHGLNISGGMLPKLASLAQAVAGGVGTVHIASWRQADVLAACLGPRASEVGTRIG